MPTELATKQQAYLDLQNAARDGQAVTAQQLAEARAAIDLAGLKAEGQVTRDRAAEQATRAAAWSAAKTAAAGRLTSHPAAIAAAWDNAVAALLALNARVNDYRADIKSVASDLSAAGSYPDQSLFDDQFRAGTTITGDPTVTLAGVQHCAQRNGMWVGSAMWKASNDLGLTTGGGSSVTSRLGGELSRRPDQAPSLTRP